MNGAIPLPEYQGIGFTVSDVYSDEGKSGYRYEKVGRYHNFHFTKDQWAWPNDERPPDTFKFDLFSPNLNKHLHVGHLRNLAIATSLSRLFKGSKFYAFLGRCLGIVGDAEQDLKEWFDFLGYHPEILSDIELSDRAGIKGDPGTGDQEGCEVFVNRWSADAPPVVLRRADGRPTYAMHDLSFAKEIGPDYYLTGAEQAEHFKSLGLGQKHLPMGLVLDPVTGKKMKSREGNALSAEDAMDLVIGKLDKTYEPRQLAWNILAWNFLHSSRQKDVKFDVDEWTRPESQGLYVTYTFARIGAAIMLGCQRDSLGKQLNRLGHPKEGLHAVVSNWKPSRNDMTQDDVNLLGFASYKTYYKERAIAGFDPAPLANFASALAMKLGSAYHEEQIASGRPGFQFAINEAYHALGDTMVLLGMFPITDV